MRITIERLRTLVLLTGGLLVVALIAFLFIGHWKNKLNLREVPHRLGADVKLDEKGVTYTQSHGSHTLFKIHASRVVQLKKDGHAQLHDVQIELYGQDGSIVDRITGDEFEYDQKGGTATAAGPVEIFIERPGAAPAVAPGAAALNPAQGKAKNPLVAMEQTASAGQIDVKTSGLTFNQKSGVATTAQRVEFASLQGRGTSMGATFDSGKGELELARAVELNVRRGGETVLIHAQHAQFQRDELTCHLVAASAGYRGGQAEMGQGTILFRQDGSAVRLEAREGFTLITANGARLASPSGSLDFNDRNQPRAGLLEGGVTMESAANGRHVQGSAPTAQLAFTPAGALRSAHLERGVVLHSDVDQPGGAHVAREWRSPVADIDFRSTRTGQLQMAGVRGTGGVVLTGQSQRAGGPVLPSRMSADQVTGEFGPNQELTRLVGFGHAALEQTTASGARQVTSGDQLEAHFASPAKGSHPAVGQPQAASEQIQSATIDGNVTLTQDQPAKPGEPALPSMRATAGHAQYEGAGEWLHLTVNPRIDDGSLQLTANKLDVSQATGNAFAHGDVKTTWLDSSGAGKTGASSAGGMSLGGQGPAHVVAAEAQLHKATGEATFRGHARLWQQSNSISAPVIVLDRAREMLVARATSPAEPVRLVMLSAGSPGRRVSGQEKPGAPASPSVIRIRASDLKYSGAERKAVLQAGPAGNVVAETPSATSSSNQAEIVLLPPGNHAAADGGSAQVDRLIARGHVEIDSQGRHGTGEQLVYNSETGEYVLTGTAAAPPRMSDPARGSVTGDALIFNTRDDSVSIEGQGQKTLTQTVAPK